MASTRQLAAIMFTDIAGYTTLMGRDEQRAFELLRINRQLQKPLIEQYGGTWIKELGDGILASFHSATDAVACACAIQQACSQTSDLKLHIGIHLGDIVFEEGDVFGDGVNIASRIQAIAPPGDVLVSEYVYTNIKNKSNVEAEFFREERFKNVAAPVQIYRIKTENNITTAPAVKGHSQQVPSKAKRFSKRLVPFAFSIIALIAVSTFFIYKKEISANATAAVVKSIAVLPFRNESTTKEENEFFCDGMMESVLNNLSQLNTLHVIARQSVEQYRNSKTPAPQIAKALGVSYILDGSVQRVGNRVKITASLIDAASNQQVWSNSFPGDLDDVFEVQEEIAQQIAGALQVKIAPDVESRIRRVPTRNSKALDIYYEAQLDFVKYAYSLPRYDLDYNRIQTLCNQALALDSNLAEAYVLKAKAYWLREISNSLKRKLNLKGLADSTEALCQKALIINNTSADALVLLYNYFSNIGKDDLAFPYLERAIVINPNHFDANVELGNYYNFLSDNTIENVEKALHYYYKALRLDPQSLSTIGVYTPLCWLYVNIGDYDKAKYYVQKAIQQDINISAKTDALRQLAIINLRVGTGDEVLQYANEQAKYDSNALYYAAEAYCYLKNDCVKAVQLYEQLFKALPEQPNIHRYAVALAKVGRKEEALKIMNTTLNENYKMYDSLGRFTGITINYDAAGICAFLDLKKEAYAILKRPPEDNRVWVFGEPELIQRDPLFDNIRNEKEFKDILKNVLEHKKTIRDQMRRLEEKDEL